MSAHPPFDLSAPRVLHIAENAVARDLESYLAAIEHLQVPPTAYVFRLSKAQLEELQNHSADSTTFSDLITRAGNVPLLAMCSDGAGIRVAEVAENGLRDLAQPESVIVLVRQADMAHVVAAAKDLCFLELSDGEHFVAPSGKHCEAFFRLGDAIRSKTALESLAFWIAPLLAHASAIIVDTWSIASLALRAMQIVGKTIPFDCLPSHPHHGPAAAESIIRTTVEENLRARGQIEENERAEGEAHDELLFLISATSSGTYAETIERVVREQFPNTKIRIAAIYGFSKGESTVNRLCTIDFDPKNHKASDCALCKADNKPIPLDPELYYVKAFPEKGVFLSGQYLSQRAFVDRYGPTPDALLLHRDDASGVHHAYYVNVAPMLASDAGFRARCQAHLDGLRGNIDLLITPQVGISHLGELANQRMGVSRIARNSLRDLSDQERALFAQSQRFAIVEDTLDAHSAARVADYVRAIRERANAQPIQRMEIVVGVGRTTSEKALDHYRVAWTTQVDWPANLEVLERFFLPDLQARQCPWCLELAFLQSAVEKSAKPISWISERIAALSVREISSLSPNPFLLLPGVAERRLAAGSVLASQDSSGTNAVFAAAAALQKLRTAKTAAEALTPHFSRYQVFAARNLHNYSETLIRAALLRAVAYKEWGINERQALEPQLQECCQLPEDALFLAGEILVAIARGAPASSALSLIDALPENRRQEVKALVAVLR